MAQQLDPLSPMVHGNEGELLMLSRRYDEAIQFFRAARERKLDFFGSRVDIAAAYLGKRMYDSAISELRTALRMGGGPIVNARLAHIYAVSGRRREASLSGRPLSTEENPCMCRTMDLRSPMPDWERPIVQSARLTNEFHARSRTMVYLGLDSYLDPIRKDPRFRDMATPCRLVRVRDFGGNGPRLTAGFDCSNALASGGRSPPFKARRPADAPAGTTERASPAACR